MKKRTIAWLTVIAATVAATGFCVAQERLERGWVKHDLQFGASPPPRSNPNLPLTDQENAGNWSLIPEFSDEFKGQQLDTNKWNTYVHAFGGRPPGYFDGRNVLQYGSNLHLVVMKRAPSPDAVLGPGFTPENLVQKGGPLSYSTGAIETKRPTLYGYYEIKARVAKATVTSAFWFWNHAKDKWTELDVFEISGGLPKDNHFDHITGHVFYDDRISSHQQLTAKVEVGSDMTRGYHVYGMDWEPNWITFYYDGYEVYKGPNTHWNQPLFMTLTTGLQPGWFGMPKDSDLPAEFDVEYVRAWRRGN